MSCQSDADQRSETARYIMFGSVALTLIMNIMLRAVVAHIIRQQIAASWKKLAFACIFFAIIKAGIALALFLYPYCPDSCANCSLSNYLYSYPCVILLVAAVWLFRAYHFWKLAGNAPANAALSQFHEALNGGRPANLCQPPTTVTYPAV